MEIGFLYTSFIKSSNEKGPESAFLIGIAPDLASEKDKTEHLEKKKMAYDWRGVYTGKYTYAVKKEEILLYNFY